VSDRTNPFALDEDFAPTKARGQNFLVDPNMANRLVDAIEPKAGDTILEVGPGTGVLTERLLARGAHVIAVETDRLLAKHLREAFAGESRLTLIEADFLTVDLSFLKDRTPRKAISNLPYSITSPALFRLITSPAPFERLVLTMQKEVAERLAARPGSKAYGRLSVLVALCGRIDKLFDLPPAVFRPRPNVVSRAIAIRPGREMNGFPGSHLERVIKAAFGMRRKQAAVALTAGLALPRERVNAALASAGIKATARAEEIAPPLYERLAAELERV
jgi:16S rRNA (adenine1518-N6/adenine1519-N6)-dimethyltransferase